MQGVLHCISANTTSKPLWYSPGVEERPLTGAGTETEYPYQEQQRDRYACSSSTKTPLQSSEDGRGRGKLVVVMMMQGGVVADVFGVGGDDGQPGCA